MNRLIDKTRIEDGCWVWQAGVNNRGYGMFYYGGRMQLAHRVSYLIFKGPIPKGLVVNHTCENTLCINPKHLKAETQKDNVKYSKTGLCKRGHLLVGDNLYINPKGHKHCRRCRRIREGKEWGG